MASIQLNNIYTLKVKDMNIIAAALIAATMLEVLNQLPQAPGNKLPSVKLEVWLYKLSANLSLHN